MKKDITTEAELEDFGEYPFVHLIKFLREKPPAQLLYQRDMIMYVEPTSRLGNGRVPQEVLDLFQHTERAIVEYDGWLWKGTELKGQHFYTREQYVPSDSILAPLQPYFNKLEGLVGKIVQSAELLPPFERFDRFGFIVPGARHLLFFSQAYQSVKSYIKKDMNVLTIVGKGPDLGDGRLLLTSLETTIARMEFTNLTGDN